LGSGIGIKVIPEKDKIEVEIEIEIKVEVEVEVQRVDVGGECYWLLACLGESGAFDEIIGFWFIRGKERLKTKPS